MTHPNKHMKANRRRQQADNKSKGSSHRAAASSSSPIAAKTETDDMQHVMRGDGKVKTIHMVRNAQAKHEAQVLPPQMAIMAQLMRQPVNLVDHDMPDPTLTEEGRDQCRQLREMTQDVHQQTAQLIVTSPLKSALETTVLMFEPLIERIGADKAIVLDILQDSGGCAHATPTAPLVTLRNSRKGIFSHLNFDLVSPDYASKRGPMFGTDNASRQARVLAVLNWLMDREEDEIVLVSHEDFMEDLLTYRPDQEKERAAKKAYWDLILGDGPDRPDLRAQSSRPSWIWDEGEIITFKLHFAAADPYHRAPILVHPEDFDSEAVAPVPTSSPVPASIAVPVSPPMPPQGPSLTHAEMVGLGHKMDLDIE